MKNGLKANGVLLAAVVVGLITLFSSGNAVAQAIPTPEATTSTSSNGASQPITLDNAKKLTRLTRIGFGFMSSADWSPDGKWLAVGGDRGVWLFSTADYSTPARLLSPDDPVSQLAFTADSTRIITVNASVREWDISSGQLLITVNQSVFPGTRVAFRLDKNLIAFNTATGANLVIWDFATNQPIKTIHGNDRHSSDVDALALAPDGNSLVVAGASGIALWDVHTGKLLRTFDVSALTPGCQYEIYRVAYHIALSPDGKRLLGTGHGNSGVIMWDMMGGQVLATFRAERFACLDNPAFSLDGKYIAAEGEGHIAGTSVVVWEANSQSVVNTFTDAEQTALAFSPDTRYLASVGLGGVTFWDIATGQPSNVPQTRFSGLNSLVFSPDGRRVATSASLDDNGRSGVLVWNMPTGVLLYTLRNPSTYSQYLTPVAFNPDGQQLVTGDATGMVYFWDANTGQLLRSLQVDTHDSSIQELLFNPNGRQLAVVDSGYYLSATNKPVHLVDLQSGTENVYLQGSDVNNLRHVAFSADGKQIVASDTDNKLRSWDTATGALKATFKSGPPNKINVLAFSSDAQYVATGDSQALVVLWDVSHTKLAATLQGHHDIVLSVAFSPDGKLLSSGGKDGQVLVWSVANRAVLASLKPGTTANGVAFSPDGTRLGAATDDGTVWVWSVQPGP